MGSDSSLVRTNDARTETGRAGVDDRNRVDAEPATKTQPSTETESTSDPNDRARSKQRNSTTNSHTYACPLCGFVDDRRATVYDHLLCSHRKGAISSALLEACSSRE